MKYIEFIPKSRITRMQLYINTGRKTLAQIKAETGAHRAINAGFFEWDWTACPILKAAGKLVSAVPWGAWVIGWDTGPDIRMHNDIVPSTGHIGTASAISGIEAITPWDGVVAPMRYNADQGGVRGRTAMGLTGDALVLYCSKDGSAAAKTPEGVRDELAALGCVSALVLDSGGSSQCDLGDGRVIVSTRVVHSLLLLWLDDETDNNFEEDGYMEIKDRLLTQSRCYTKPERVTLTRAMLHSTGTPGASAAAIAASWDNQTASACVHYAIDASGIYRLLPLEYKAWHAGGTANSTHASAEICEPVETAVIPVNWVNLSPTLSSTLKAAPRVRYQATRLQMELTRLGYDPKGIDGSYGPGCQAAVRAYQTANKLTADGIVGPATLAALQKPTASLLRYQTADAQPYFDVVYRHAVQLFAHILTELGGKASEIVSHAEGYKMAIASNHADVGHWFPLHGVSMDDFRADVAAVAAPVPVADPHAAAVAKLVAAGVIGNPDYWLGDSYSAANVRALIAKMAEKV